MFTNNYHLFINIVLKINITFFRLVDVRYLLCSAYFTEYQGFNKNEKLAIFKARLLRYIIIIGDTFFFRLEVKLSALGEKKSDLQVQLQQNARSMSNLRSSLTEEERKKNEARQHAAKMEAFANRLEQQNFEMEEKEVEIRYRLHTLENVVPAMVMYYLWKMLNVIRPLDFDSCNNKQLPLSSKSDSVVYKTEQPEKPKRHCKTLQRTNVDEEHLRRVSLDDLEQFLNSRQEGVIPESSDIAVDAAFLYIEKLSQRCHVMEERIKELELKEKLYQETLQNGDELLVKMEVEYKNQIKYLEDELNQKHSDLERAKSLMRKHSHDQEMEQQFQERLTQLEVEIKHLQEALSQKEREHKLLEEEKIRLAFELEESLENIDKFKENIEKPLREEVEYQKKRVRELLGDLDLREQEKEESDERHIKLVSKRVFKAY